VVVCARRDSAAARAFFAGALNRGPAPVQVTTDRAPPYPRVIDELVPGARDVLEWYANSLVEADHGRLKARLRPTRGVRTIRWLRSVAAGHAFAQNLRRGHSQLTSNGQPTIKSAPRSPNSHPACDRSRPGPDDAEADPDRSTQQCRSGQSHPCSRANLATTEVRHRRGFVHRIISRASGAVARFGETRLAGRETLSVATSWAQTATRVMSLT
jgi:IS6 family transposase